MDSKTGKSIKWLLILMMVTMAVSYYVITTLYPGAKILLESVAAISLFFLCFGSFTFLTLDKVKSDAMKYNRTFLALTTIKLFLSSFGAIVFVLTNREQAVPFLISLGIIFAIYTVYEVIALTKLK